MVQNVKSQTPEKENEKDTPSTLVPAENNSVNNSSSAEDSTTMSVSADIKKQPRRLPKGIPEGKYKLVGWAAGVTGRRLIDEIFHIATYTTESQFSEYIMPYNDIKYYFRNQNNVMIRTNGLYRMLTDMRTGKFIQTKSEINAMTDFVKWLEANATGSPSNDVESKEIDDEQTPSDVGKDGIILVYHEMSKVSPAILLEALRRNHLLERFSKVVKGFANCYALAKDKCAGTMKAFNLHILAKVLLDKDEDTRNAVVRSKLCHDIVTHLGQSERQDLDANASGDAKVNNEFTINMIRPFTNPVEAEEDEIKQFKTILDRQKTFHNIFFLFLRGSFTERKRAIYLRRLLAENNIDYEKVKDTFKEKAKDGLEELLKSEVPNAKDKDLDELVELLDCYLDPDKKALEPKRKFFRNSMPFRRFAPMRSRNTRNSRSQRENGQTNSSETTEEKVTPAQSPIEDEQSEVKQEPVAAS